MRFEELIATVGEQRYRLACEWAWRTAAEAGNARPEAWPEELEDVPHDLSDPLWVEGDISMGERLALAIRLLWEMPCYANTMYMHGFYGDWSADHRASFWGAYVAMLDGDDERQAAPVGYSLWVDLFGPDDRGQDAWDAVFGQGRATPAVRLDRVLPLTGPVPWQVKAPLFEELVADVARHPAVFLALLGAEFDYFGANDRQAALKILGGLVLPRSTEHVDDLRRRLSGGA